MVEAVCRTWLLCRLLSWLIQARMNDVCSVRVVGIRKQVIESRGAVPHRLVIRPIFGRRRHTHHPVPTVLGRQSMCRWNAVAPGAWRDTGDAVVRMLHMGTTDNRTTSCSATRISDAGHRLGSADRSSRSLGVSGGSCDNCRQDWNTRWLCRRPKQLIQLRCWFHRPIGCLLAGWRFHFQS